MESFHEPNNGGLTPSPVSIEHENHFDIPSESELVQNTIAVGSSSHEKIINIASHLLTQAPPGELSEVLGDIRCIVRNDELLKRELALPLEQFNMDHHVAVTLPGMDYKVLLTRYNKLNENPFLFFDPISGYKFLYHPISQTVALTEDYIDKYDPLEEARVHLQDSMDIYVKSHYPNGVAMVVSEPDDLLHICLVSEKGSIENFWSGFWLSDWCLNLTEQKLMGKVSVKVHYYEDGNVQQNASRCYTLHLESTQDKAELAHKVACFIGESEQKIQSALLECYQQLSETTFKGLRRALPITRTKIDWDKIQFMTGMKIV